MITNKKKNYIESYLDFLLIHSPSESPLYILTDERFWLSHIILVKTVITFL